MSRAGWTVVSLGIVAALGMIGVMTGGLSGAAAMRSSRTAMAQLASLDRALGANDIDTATRAWRDAYGAALGSRRWEPMFAVGVAALRIGRAAGAPRSYDLGDREVALRALRIAEILTRRTGIDPSAAPPSAPGPRTAAPSRRRELREAP